MTVKAVRVGTTDGWQDIALVGPKGDQGEIGPQGPKGDTGAVGPAPPAVPYISGDWFPAWMAPTLTTLTFPIQALRVTRIIVPVNVVQASCEVATLSAGAILRVMAYADASSPSQPGALVLQSASSDGGVAGLKTFPFVLSPGTYWIGMQNIAASGGAPTMRAFGGFNALLPGIALVGNTTYNGWQNTGAGTAVPDPFPMAGTTKNSISSPAIFFQAA